MRHRRHSTPIRRRWYEQWRRIRIFRRETAKAWEDMIVFGTGIVAYTTEPPFIKHIPINKVIFASAKEIH
jgi:hypothetical protein